MKFNACLLFCVLAFLLASCDDDPKKPSATPDQMTTVIVDMMQTTTDQKITTDQEIIKDMDLAEDQSTEDAEVMVDMNTTTFVACADGVDNDSDGLVDLFDTDCVGNQDTTEDQTTISVKCLNGMDDDNDEMIDFPLDIGCSGAGDDDEADLLSAPLCANGQDDDRDGKTDFPYDPGCSGIGDLDETDSPIPPLCANGQDDDGDGLIDFPEDGTCVSAGAWSEEIFCAQRDVADLNALTLENGYYDGDLTTLGNSQIQGNCGGGAGPEQIFVWRASRPFKKVTFNTIYDQTTKPVVVYVRSACTSTTDLACDRGTSEITGTSVSIQNIDAGLFYVFVDTSSPTAGPGTFRISVETTEAEACRDTVDNDRDGKVDLLDPGCTSEFDIDETDPANLPQCADQIDNDNDGATDYPSDSDCSAAGATKEGPLCAIDYRNSFTVPAGGGTLTVPFNPNFNTSVTDGCRANSGPEAMATITLEEASTIKVSFTDTTAPFSAYLRSDCASSDQIACTPNANAALNTDILSAGTYFLFIDYNTADSIPVNNPKIQVIITPQVTECNDQEDNDADQLIDLFDPGCTGNQDDSEINGADLPACADGIDNDADGEIDYPSDAQCSAAGQISENITCTGVTNLPILGMDGGEVTIDTSINQDVFGPDQCFRGDGPDAPVALILTSPASVVARTSSSVSTIDTILYVRKDNCEELSAELDCNDDYDFFSDTHFSELSFDRLEPGVYYFIIDGYRVADAGPITLSLAVTPLTVTVSQCNDNADNDGDNLIDSQDLGCSSFQDNDETNPATLPACADGIDNDQDNAIDFPNDTDCLFAGDANEDLRCTQFESVDLVGTQATVFPEGNANESMQLGCGTTGGYPSIISFEVPELSDVTINITGDNGTQDAVDRYLAVRSICEDVMSEKSCGLVEDGSSKKSYLLPAGRYYAIIGRASISDREALNVTFSYTSRVTECNDEIDNDADQKIDLLDPGCTGNQDDSEINGADLPACADGIDNDADGEIDYPSDAQCLAAGQIMENITCTGVTNLPILGMDGGEVTIDTSINQDVFVPDQCFRADGPDAPVALILTSPASVVARTSSSVSTIDTILYVRKDNCDELSAELDCNDDYDFFSDTRFSELSFDRLEPGVYYFIIDGYGVADAGPITLSLAVTPLTITVSQCNDNADNDGDNLIDSQDLGCSSFQDNDETNPATLPACADGIDNDQDNAIDFPNDTDCLFAGDANEDLRCTQFESVDLVGTQATVFPEGNANESMQLGCGTTGGYPSIISFEVPELSDVTINITGDNGTQDAVDRYLAVRSICEDVMSEKSCGLVEDGSSKKIYLLPAGRYYAIIGRASISDREALNVTFSYTSRVTECNDEIDNDADQKIDLLDPGCVDGNSRSEIDPEQVPVCADGIDNDNDNNIDYPADQNCTGAGGAYEASLCNDFSAIYVSDQGGEYRFEPIDGQSGTDSTCSFGTGDEAVFAIQVAELSDIILNVTEDNGDIARVYRSLRTSCDDIDTQLDCLSSFDNANSFTNLEAGIYYLFVERSESSTPNPFNVSITIRSLITSCNDEVDNDADDKIDRADPGCSNDLDDDETDPDVLPACADGLDNDGDFLIDYPQDTQCNRAAQAQETAYCDQATIEQFFYQDPTNTDLVNTFSAMVSTLGGVNQYNATCGSSAASPEKVIALNLTQRSNVVIETSNASGTFDTVLHARKTFCDDASAQIGCDDDGAEPARMSKLSLNALESGNYFIFVDGFGGSNSGSVTVTVTVTRLVVPTTQCTDGIDNDGDQLVDDVDPGCNSFQDNDEIDLAVMPACSDTVDNDMDGDIDYPNDADCLFAGDSTEDFRCATLESVELVGDRIEVMPEPNADISVAGSCETPIGQPSIIAFEVTEISDVAITVKNSNAMATTANRVLFVRSACDDNTTELSCKLMNSTSTANLTLLPRGRYYAFIGRTSTEDRQPLTVTFSFTSRVTQCNDEIDNDGDQQIDLMDTGCITSQSASEDDPAQTPICADGLDNDMDGQTDYPQDPECTAAGGLYEASLCTGFDAVFVNGIGGTYRFEPVDNQSASEPICTSFGDTGDEAVFAVQLTTLSNIILDVTNDDGNSTFVYRSLRTTCDDVTTEAYCLDNFDETDRFENLSPGIYYLFVERADYSSPNPFNVQITIDSLVKQCNDGIDNDGDNRIDQFDAGCSTSTDNDETDGQSLPECADGLDNDMDGDIDFPDDLECTRAGQNQEQVSCDLAPVAETLIQESRVITLNTATEMNNYTASCGSSARSSEKVFAVVLHEPSNIVATITNAATGYDTVMYVRKDDCDLSTAELRCDDDGAGLPLSKITLNRMDPGIYYFFVDGYSTDNSGEATVDVVVTPIAMP